ncbi:MAG TPA: hypothetical protein VKZ79_20995, partial [Alphaproteobacteria bacterium]|nr:hypothetical protein [Alphaproteobacteria bacterium]
MGRSIAALFLATPHCRRAGLAGQDHESLRCEQGRSEIGVDGGFETLSFDGDFARFVLEEIERSVAH